MKSGGEKNIRPILILLIILIISGFSLAIAKTVLWKYKDSKGRYHYVDEAYKIPEKYRKSAVKVVIEGAKVHPTPKHSSPPPKVSPEEAEEAKKKAEWQQRARNAVKNVEKLEEIVARLKQNPDLFDALTKSFIFRILVGSRSSGKNTKTTSSPQVLPTQGLSSWKRSSVIG